MKMNEIFEQASKQQRKFSCAAPDLTFSAICDRTRQVSYIRASLTIRQTKQSALDIREK
jgi:hypothetical protein